MSCGVQQAKSTVTLLNNMGADLIECGDYVGSIEFLSKAFQYSRQELDDRMASDVVIPDIYQPSACVIDLWMMRDIAEDSSQEQGDDVIYTLPMHVPLKATNPSEVSVAVAITFNLAIAYHHASRHCNSIIALQGNSQEQLMRQALRLYQYTFRLQRTQASSSQSPFFYMACINNIGTLFHELGENIQSEECFNHLLSLLMYMNMNAGGGGAGRGGEDVFVDPSRFAFFFLNTTRFVHDSCSLGAAAA